MLRTRRTPKDRAAFPTELPSGLRIPAGVSPETYASHRDVLSVLLLYDQPHSRDVSGL